MYTVMSWKVVNNVYGKTALIIDTKEPNPYGNHHRIIKVTHNNNENTLRNRILTLLNSFNFEAFDKDAIFSEIVKHLVPEKPWRDISKGGKTWVDQ